MKKLNVLNEVYTLKNDTIYQTDGGVYVRDVLIDAGIGQEVFIGHLSDIHLNRCNEEDMRKADPVLMSTHKNRIWNANGETVMHLKRALEILDDSDQLILNGDTLDYISKLVKEKVMVVGMLNDRASFYDVQYERLKSDIERARRSGYVILLFCHEPIATKNPLHQKITAKDMMHLGDPNYPQNLETDFCNGTRGETIYAGCKKCDDATKKVYSLITESADVIKGVFTAHVHNDIHLDILAETKDGEKTFIPQYVNTALAYDNGHLMRILIK